VAGFIAMLKVALMAVLTATLAAPGAGTADTTDGTLTTSWPHPATKTTHRDAKRHVIPILILRICNLSSSVDGAVSNNRHSDGAGGNPGNTRTHQK
jgi:hypothetical protein